MAIGRVGVLARLVTAFEAAFRPVEDNFWHRVLVRRRAGKGVRQPVVSGLTNGCRSLKLGPKYQFRMVRNWFFGAAGRFACGRAQRALLVEKARREIQELFEARRRGNCAPRKRSDDSPARSISTTMPRRRFCPKRATAMVAALDLTGNPSSVHGHGRALRGADRGLPAAKVAKLAGADARAGGLHRLGHRSDHPGHRRRRQGARRRRDRRVSAGEHTAVLKAAEATGLPVTHRRARRRRR